MISKMWNDIEFANNYSFGVSVSEAELAFNKLGQAMRGEYIPDAGTCSYLRGEYIPDAGTCSYCGTRSDESLFHPGTCVNCGGRLYE